MDAKVKEVELLFRSTLDPDQWQYLHPKIYKIFYFLNSCCEEFGCDLVITSMIRPANTIKGESNVHATGRSIDCVAQAKKPMVGPNPFRIYDFSKKLSELANIIYKRADGKESVMFHDAGSGNHFHIQVPYDVKYKDLDGRKPSGGIHGSTDKT
jgi:hypothetical protein